MVPGETRMISVNFPEEYNAKELAGKQAEFEITAKSLAVPKIPTIDEEFAKAMGLEFAGRPAKATSPSRSAVNTSSCPA